MDNLQFNPEEYTKFKKLYEKAVKDKTEMFVFQDKEILTAYAKYVLEYISPRFENNQDGTLN